MGTFDTWAVEAHLHTEENLPGVGRNQNGPVIGIDAAYFLEQFRHPSKEPLVPALGGYPMALEAFITKQIKDIESVGCKLWFYFDGLDCVSNEESFTTSIKSMGVVSEAFAIYEMGEAARAIEKFRQSDFPDMLTLVLFTKCTLHKHSVPFVVAPFRAHAQMMHHMEEGLIDAIYGSSELFLFGAERIITKFSFHYESREYDDQNGYIKKENKFSPEKSMFTWLEKETCLKMLGDVSHDVFTDALIIAGCSYIDTFPPLLNALQYPQPFTFRNVIDLLLQCRNDIHRLCVLYQHDDVLNQTNWEDRFMRTYAAINHMVVLYTHDVVKPRSYAKAARYGRVPRDLHEIVGLTLPEELHFYLYNGLVGPMVMNWLISGKIRILAPLAGGESSQYRRLVKEQLHPWRQQALALLAYSINRWYQSRDITTLFWFGEASEQFNMKDINSPKQKLFSWRVQSNALNKRLDELHTTSIERGLGSIYFALRSLESAEFASISMGKKSATYEPLTSADEIVTNVIWRFLYLRGYLTQEHQLTAWGKLLLHMLEGLGESSTKDQAEAVFVAVELIRLGLLNADEVSSEHAGPATRGNEYDKQYCLLASRVSCTGKMRHPTKGYSGPLSRQLLAYHCLVTEVRRCLRSLVEMTIIVLFLEADAVRIRDDYTELSKRLPFQEHSSAGLGVITKIYLDELVASQNPLSKSQQQDIMDRAESWFIHIDVAGSFNDACQLWDAVLQGIKASGALLSEEEKKTWFEADQWLSARRP